MNNKEHISKFVHMTLYILKEIESLVKNNNDINKNNIIKELNRAIVSCLNLSKEIEILKRTDKTTEYKFVEQNNYQSNWEYDKHDENSIYWGQEK